jgi:hypothetical protein
MTNTVTFRFVSNVTDPRARNLELDDIVPKPLANNARGNDENQTLPLSADTLPKPDVFGIGSSILALG